MSQAPLDLEAILTQTFLATAEHYLVLGSTNDWAKMRVGRGAELPLLIVADRQTAGRGRGLNRWWTGPGGLALSVALAAEQLPGDLRHASLIALAAGLAVVDAVAPLLPDAPLGIHWPNDVMVGSRKLAGVLVEASGRRGTIVGIGLNINNTATDAPAEIRQRVATVKDATGREHDPTVVLVELLGYLQQRMEQLTDAPEQLAADANQRCLQCGRKLRVDSGGRTVEGTCAGIESDGALRLDTLQGRRVFHSATVQDA